MYITHLVFFIRMRIAWGIASVFYLLALCFVFHTTGQADHLGM